MRWLPSRWSPECWSVSYFLNRLRAFWYVRTHPEWPWLTPEANRVLDAVLSGRERVLEFGCGGSTLFFARRAAHVLGIETSPAWLERTRRALDARGLADRAELRRVKAGGGLGLPEGARFDLVLVDGGDRLAAAEAAADLLAPGGWLVVDNINRHIPNDSPGPGSLRAWDEDDPDHRRWRDWWARLEGWPRRWTSNGVTDTLLARRPGPGFDASTAWRKVDLAAGD